MTEIIVAGKGQNEQDKKIVSRAKSAAVEFSVPFFVSNAL